MRMAENYSEIHQERIPHFLRGPHHSSPPLVRRQRDPSADATLIGSIIDKNKQTRTRRESVSSIAEVDRLEDKVIQLERGRNKKAVNHSLDGYIRDVTRSNDMTVHLELDLVDDPGICLDEFLRLTRLGHFNAARLLSCELARAQRRPMHICAVC